MINPEFIAQNPYFPYIATAITVWELIWKGMALWRAAHLKSRNWFIVLLAINSMGILPILYLYFFSKKTNKKK